MKDILTSYIGTACEIKTLENELLTLGRVTKIVEGLTLSLDIVSMDGGALMSSQYGIPVKICLHNNAHGLLIVGGRVYMANEDFWRISNISQYQAQEQRDFFRVACTATGVIAQCEDTTEEYSARLINISLSGAQLTTANSLEVGDKARLSNCKLGDDANPFSFVCEVMRISTRKDDYSIYHCRFTEVSRKDSDRLCKAIFAIQREIIKKRRNVI